LSSHLNGLSPASNAKDPKTNATDVAQRVRSGLDVVALGVDSIDDSRVADIALRAKGDANGSVLEKKSDVVSLADEVVDSEPAHEGASRRLPRPPVFESSGLLSGAAVSKK